MTPGKCTKQLKTSFHLCVTSWKFIYEKMFMMIDHIVLHVLANETYFGQRYEYGFILTSHLTFKYHLKTILKLTGKNSLNY